ncbi:catenin alpha-2-like isoform X4, partial [Biomphalaria glabrata]
AYVRQPELAAAHSNREYAYKQVGDAVNTISDVAQASGQSDVHAYKGPGELAAALNKLDHKINMDPLSYNEVRSRPSLEHVESIISEAALMADSSCTRDDRRETIVQALQDLLTEYMNK